MMNIKDNLHYPVIMIIIAWIVYLSTQSMKLKAQTPAQDKKQNAITINITPDQLRDRIRVLAADSARLAQMTRVSAHLRDYIEQYNTVAPKLTQEMIRHKMKDAPISTADFQKIFDLWANQQNITNEIVGTSEYIANEIKWAAPSEKSRDSINRELADMRLLLKLASEHQK